MSGRFLMMAALVLSALLACACVSGGGVNEAGTAARVAEPSVEVSPVDQGEGGWKVATGDAVTFTVTAPGAETVKLLYRPVVADADRHVELRTIGAPTERAGGKFTAEVRTPPDFAGEVWARVSYPGGVTKESQAVALTTRTADGETVPADEGASAPGATPPAAGQKSKTEATGEFTESAAERATDTDESARSDKFTGGRIRQASLRLGQPDIRITVNVPAFTLTLWQDGKQVKTYPVGVGRKEFPIPAGMRQATQVIFNPAWVPPDSSWVRASSSVEPYERIPADDPRNPLGKVKFPLGSGYLLHEAAEPSDIGSLVSHGCVRLLTDDLFDLAEKVIEARGLPVTDAEVARLRSNTERRAVGLGDPVPVDINYDTLVVEGGALHVYPDVYGRGTNTSARLREELRSSGVEESRLEEKMLNQILERVSKSEEFVVKVSDIRAGRALEAGRPEPLPGHARKEEAGNAGKKSPGLPH